MTNHRNLRSILLSAAAAVLIIAAFFSLFLKNHTSSARLPDRYHDKISAYFSQTDEDKDGIDDQTDILQSALRYTETHPVVSGFSARQIRYCRHESWILV